MHKNTKAVLIIAVLLIVMLGLRLIMGITRGNEVAEEPVQQEPLPVIDIKPIELPSDKPEVDVSKFNISEGEAEENMENDNNVTSINEDELFYISEISDDLFEKMKGKSFKDDCTLPRSDLRYVHVLHKTLTGETLTGELVVNYHIAEDTLEIFRALYDAGYPIEKIRLIDEYDADDESSMSDNNSSSFNFRFVSRTKNISKHGYGLAIDINPLYNPYITTVDGQTNVEPANATEYVDRESDFDYKITHDDLVYKLFKEHGFDWGGDWTNSKDYQHFEIPSDKIKEWY